MLTGLLDSIIPIRQYATPACSHNLPEVITQSAPLASISCLIITSAVMLTWPSEPVNGRISESATVQDLSP